jgi:peptide-methionine (S)-S-oxide reductase
MQSVLEPIPGVLSVTVGYMGGATKDPTYEHLRGTGNTEVARVVFDPGRTSLEKILHVFWTAHRLTGTQSPTARSVIFYYTDAQRSIAAKSKADTAKLFSQPVATEIAKAGQFYAAEEYHQDYYKKHGAVTCGL